MMFRNTCRVRFSNFTNNKMKPKIFKSLTVFFLISQFIFGINFGFSAVLKKKYRTIAQYLTFCISVLHIINITAPFFYMPLNFDKWFNIIEYPAYFIVLNTVKYTVYDFIRDMHEIYELKESEKLVVKLIALFFLTIMFIIKITVDILGCVFGIDCKIYLSSHEILYSMTGHGLDVCAVTQILIYYYFQCYARHLKEILARSVKNVNIVEKKYILVVRCYDKIRNLYDKMTILELFIGVPKMMITLWWMLRHFVKNDLFMETLIELVFASHIAIQIALPAITAENLNSQIDALRRLLDEYLRTETDDRTKADITRLSQYIDRRPLKHLVLRFIPTDLRQIISVISLCTTYFIVIIQFTHLVE